MIRILALLLFGILHWYSFVIGMVSLPVTFTMNSLCDELCGLLQHLDTQFDICIGIYYEIVWDIYNDICSRIYFEIPFGLRDYMISTKMDFDDYGVVGPQQSWPLWRAATMTM